METKYKVVICSVVVLTSFAFGRFSAPEKVRIETKTVEVEKKTEQKETAANQHKEVTVTEVVKPDGTKETTTKTTEDIIRKTDTVDKVVDAKEADTSKEVTRGSSKVTVSALAGINLSDPTKPPVLGASVTKPMLGPITTGLWGFTDKTVGVSIGLTF